MATASRDETARVFDGELGCCAAVLRGHTGAVYSVRFDGGVHCATAAMDGAVRVWDVVEGEEAVVLVDAHAAGATGATFDADGRRLLTGGRDRTAALWDVAAVFATAGDDVR